ncbi:hypothetical protein J3Q64DRAFT_1654658 [Phycomyces blakesleeanus]|uniref:BZIP domain-containing protein n=2 Tax=Phycomyces blakesleeanus TaxID=4837 RepID=A0ABR3BB46_PHYBL
MSTESYFDDSMSQDTADAQPSPAPQPEGPPIKIRKKPGRKPNPASPALRKAQNRAAQRAFRERKERHMRDLEVTIKQMREQREKVYSENEQLKSDNEVLKCENWYLKGIVLTLQLVCYQHNLVIPQHSPHINDQALAVLAQSSPAPISAYVKLNANNKLPIVPKFLGLQNRKHRDKHTSSGSIIITQDGIHSQHQLQQNQQQYHNSDSNNHNHNHSHNNDISRQDRSPSFSNLPDLSPVPVAESPPYFPGDSNMNTSSDEATAQPHQEEPNLARPTKLLNDPLTSNLAAIQTLRLRLRLQSACIRMKSIPFAIQPTLLQLTVPHDPRIDLIPTPHMRDRMILFQHQFDLDDCFRCLLGSSVFHGNDPAVAGNWELPQEFFEKFWFLTIDYDLRRTTNRWRRLQGLQDLKTFDKPVDTALSTQLASSIYPPRTINSISATTNSIPIPVHPSPVAAAGNGGGGGASNISAGNPQGPMMLNDLSSFLGIDFGPMSQSARPPHNHQIGSSVGSCSSSVSSDSVRSNQSQSQSTMMPTETGKLTGIPNTITGQQQPTLIPIRLTNGYAGYSPYAQIPSTLKQQQQQQQQHLQSHQNSLNPHNNMQQIHSNNNNNNDTIQPVHPPTMLQNFPSWDAFIREPGEYGINLADFSLDEHLGNDS